MKWIRCFSLLFVFLMLFASTTFGEVGTRSITIENKSVYTAYVAYVYAVDAEVSAFGGINWLPR